jgi:ribosomal protein S18 acetylase RimI-like enzyme
LTADGERIYNQIEPLMAEAENSLEHLLSETGYDIADVITKLENALSQKKCYSRVVSSVKSKQMNEVKIVPYNKKYKADFKRLNVEWLQKYFSVEPADEKLLSSPEKEIIRNGGEIFFALLENEVTGTCAVLKVDEVTFELAKMAVDEKAQGKQIGKKLCLTAIGYAISNNAEKIVLDTNNKLEAAINLYRSLGFLAVPHKYNDKYKRDLLRMELNLKSV